MFYILQYHIVWCTKYRKQILKDGIDEDVKQMLQEIAWEYSKMAVPEKAELKKELCGGYLWNLSYCAVTVNDRSRGGTLYQNR